LPTTCDEALAHACDFASYPDCDLGLRCREGQPGLVGDPCASDVDCQWPCAPTAAGGVENRYQACDEASGLCVATAPVEVTDWGAGCGLTVEEAAVVIAHNRRTLVVAREACSEGLCYLDEDYGKPCVAHGCTKPCAGDHECPLGRVCGSRWRVDLQGDPDAGTEQKVCLPKPSDPHETMCSY
jgi:hypothetical protein